MAYLREKEEIGIIQSAVALTNTHYDPIELSIWGISHKMWDTVVRPQFIKSWEITEYTISRSIDYAPNVDIHLTLKIKGKS